MERFRKETDWASPNRDVQVNAERFQRTRSFKEAVSALNQPAFSRYSVFRRRHPMSGGVASVQHDHVAVHSSYRKRVFDVDLVPLPRSLALSMADAERNAHAKVI